VNAPATRLSPFADRQIGLVGTWARIIGGALAVILPIALRGFSWIEAGVALVALPAIAALTAPLITAIYRRVVPKAIHSRHATCSPLGCTLIAVMVAANAALVAPSAGRRSR
jgi:hypothetical protein